MRTPRYYANRNWYNNGHHEYAELNTSHQVKEIQAFLLKKGYDLGHWGVDGDLGSKTKKAIYDYFRSHFGASNPTSPSTPSPGVNAPQIVQTFSEIFRKKGYTFYKDELKPNIIGVRNLDSTANLFNDTMYVIWKENGRYHAKTYLITTDPGSAFLGKRMINKNGTAILKVGQYLNTYKLGLHRGKYTALVQRGGKVTVYRDKNQDHKLDFHGGKEYTGYFGINIHKAGRNSIDVNSWSAGCQVFKKSSDFDELIALCKKAERRYGKGTWFTYTLLEASKGKVL
ncbi:peptidoglycan-binding domain-containing protein [Aquimarina spongiae]|uniref:Peptidoglycan binding domain-containing protein n=1 Tax=Aquimarina spongiae TaxID=570521 RepID=A0A1M6B9N4_9FLAO|nr:hypothetical protein [Aquimarina spongiae]SHI45449.1 hypothetical protein SAMN04488508_101702 [Aquimarina spongiae]